MIARRLILSLFLSLVGSALFTFWLSQKFNKAHVVEPPKTLGYVTSSVPIQAGEVLNPANVKIVQWPITSPLEGAFAKPEQVAGRTVLYPLAAGQPILNTQLSAAGSGIGLTAKIPEGMRAISLRSDQIVGVAGFLLPGTHVDVLVTFHPQNSPDAITTTVLQDAQVLAAGQKMTPDADAKAATTDVVTLLVNPEDAERVVLASQQGTVHFVLRNGSDHEKTNGAPAQVSSFGGYTPTQAPNLKTAGAGGAPAPLLLRKGPAPQAAPKPYTVVTMYGNKQVTETIPQ
ncbi:pilus assembly protein CpaB [Granulicella rosea]|uniref:Pilus assembly protein CpaB n=1 Tax=Granulicella rosea TaxID=474952 RepID=A0A239ERZ2_9BACT|nr:Flp pilus assembly protein CpaB [Granulicella rosea]SNS47181.1 pilus assembly protein CpaB [Granulicella rosea]